MGGSRFSTLIVAASPEIETAAFVVEQIARVREEIGPVEAFLGFSPRKIRMDPGARHRDAYARSYYWREFLRIPQYVEKVRPSMAFLAATAAKTAWSVAAALLPAAGKMIAGAGTHGFFESIKRHHVRKIEAGTHVLSDYLRSDRFSRGDLRIHPPFFATLAICHFYLHYWLDVARGEDFSRMLFLNSETTYRMELVRRALLQRGASEVYCDRWDDGRMRVSSAHREGRDLVLCTPTRTALAPDERESVRAELERRLSGEATYAYMGTDIEGHLKARYCGAASRDATSNKPRAVVFMHAVADAQHFFGDDCFIDLHHWLETSIRLLLAQGFLVYVKLHPCYYDSHPKRRADRRYKNFIEGYLGASWDSLEPGGIAPAALEEGVRIVDYRLNIASVRALLGPMICITHHGTIATEATALGIPVVCSRANAFQHFPPFAWMYKTLDEYQALLARYVEGQLQVDEPRLANLYLYLFETRRDSWTWLWQEYRRLSGYNFVDEPDRFADFLLAIGPDDGELFTQVRNVFALRRGAGAGMSAHGSAVGR